VAVGAERELRLVAGGKSVGCVETGGAGRGLAAEAPGDAGEADGAEGMDGAPGDCVEDRKDSGRGIGGIPYCCT
jgi:hypothetical protein